MNAIAVFEPNSTSNIGKISGVVIFHQCCPENKTHVKFQLKGFVPNTTHGVHIHRYADIDEGCKGACEHFNPYESKHGSYVLYKDSRHVGDLCNNILSDKNGEVNYEYDDDLVDLIGKFTVIGRSVVIHAKEDDLGRYRDEDTKRGVESGKTGNAGDRIACSVIGLSSKNSCPSINNTKYYYK